MLSLEPQNVLSLVAVDYFVHCFEISPDTLVEKGAIYHATTNPSRKNFEDCLKPVEKNFKGASISLSLLSFECVQKIYTKELKNVCHCLELEVKIIRSGSIFGLDTEVWLELHSTEVRN